MDALQRDLKAAGRDVAVTAVNIISAEPTQAELIKSTSYPVFQDVGTVNAWAQMGGGKDDFYVYGSDGKLARYLRYGGDVDTNLSDPTAYEAFKQIVIDTK